MRKSFSGENSRIPKFRRFVIQNFPFIEEDFDALTDYGLLCKVVEYLNKVIGSQNDVVAEMNRVLEYFENLDVQDEINNKLEEMAESGELAAIIAEYLNGQAIQSFGTVADMQASTILINGAYAQTFGFHSINDGGAGKYRIRTITNSDTIDNMTLFAIGSGNLVAELVVSEILPETLGAYGDGEHDDSAVINKLIVLGDQCRKISFSPRTYGVSSTILVKPNLQKCNVDFNGCRLKALTDGMTVVRVDGSDLQFHANGSVRHLQIWCNRKASVGMEVVSSWRITYDDVNISYIPINGIGLWVKSNGGNIFTNFRGEGTFEEEYSSSSDYNTFVVIDGADNTFDNFDYYRCKRGFDINNYSMLSNIHGFVSTEMMYYGSYFMKLNSSCMMTNVYPDTQQFAFIDNTNGLVTITNCQLTFAHDMIGSDITSVQPSFAFVGTSSGKNNIKVLGLRVENNVQELYLETTTTFYGTDYYQVYLVADMVGTSYTSTSYRTDTMYIKPIEQSYFTIISSRCNNKNAHVYVRCLADNTNYVDIGEWYKAIFKNYSLIEGWYLGVARRDSNTLFPVLINVDSNQLISIKTPCQANDYIWFDLPVVERQIGS